MKVNAPAIAQSSAPQGPKISNSGSQESVGDIANRVANSGKPSGRRVQGKGSSQLDKDAFFKLMLAQVKNQDPTNPMKNHEMAAQLAQFSSLEQMSNVNETLKVMQKGQGEGMQFQALDLMGKVVSGDNSKINRAAGDSSHDVSFHLKEAASDVKIAIADANGNVIKNLSMKNAPQGAGKIQWDGKDDDGVMQPAGSYKISVDAKDSVGKKVSTQTEFSGKVTGVQFSEAGPIVSIGNKTVALKDIKKIEEATAQISSSVSSQGDAAQAALQKMVPNSARMGVPLEQSLPNIDIASLTNNLNRVK